MMRFGSSKICSYGATPGNDQVLLLVLHSGIFNGGKLGMLGNELGSVMYFLSSPKLHFENFLFIMNEYENFLFIMSEFYQMPFLYLLRYRVKYFIHFK